MQPRYESGQEILRQNEKTRSPEHDPGNCFGATHRPSSFSARKYPEMVSAVSLHSVSSVLSPELCVQHFSAAPKNTRTTCGYVRDTTLATVNSKSEIQWGKYKTGKSFYRLRKTQN